MPSILHFPTQAQHSIIPATICLRTPLQELKMQFGLHIVGHLQQAQIPIELGGKTPPIRII